MTGILTRYNNYVQLVISSLNDLENFTTPQTLQTIFSVNYANAFNEGWFQLGSGNPWEILSNTSFNGFVNNPAVGQDNWLISPAIDLSNVNSPVLSFTHRAPQGFNNAKMKVYYTPNFSGDVNSTLWIELPLSITDGTTTSVNESINLPKGAQTSGFRMLFRMTGKASSWYLSNIKIEALR